MCRSRFRVEPNDLERRVIRTGHVGFTFRLRCTFLRSTSVPDACDVRENCAGSTTTTVLGVEASRPHSGCALLAVGSRSPPHEGFLLFPSGDPRWKATAIPRPTDAYD